VLKSASANPIVLPLKRYFILLLLVQYIRFLRHPSAHSTMESFSWKYRGLSVKMQCIEAMYRNSPLIYIAKNKNRLRYISYNQRYLRSIYFKIASHINTFVQHKLWVF